MHNPIPIAKSPNFLSGLFFWISILLVFFVYTVPMWVGPRPIPMLISPDEGWYAARLARAAQGQMVPGNPFLIEHSKSSNVVPTLTESILGITLHVWNKITNTDVSVETLILLTRAILPIFIFILFFQAFQFLEMSSILATFCAFIILCDPEYIFCRSLLVNFGKNDFMFLNRIVNPLYNLPIFLLAWLAGLRAFFAHDSSARTKWTLISGSLGGLLFYTSIYYWLHLGLASFLIALLTKQHKRWFVFSTSSILALFISLPYWIHSMSINSNPNYKNWVWVHGLLAHETNVWQLQSKTLWTAILISTVLLIKGSDKKKSLYISTAVGLALYLSPIVTKITLQSWHWKYTFCPLGVACVIWSLSILSQRWRIPRIWLNVAVISYTVVTFLAAFTVSSHQYANASKGDYIPEQGMYTPTKNDLIVFRWIRENTPLDSVILAPVNMMTQIPIRTGRWVWSDNHMIADLVSLNEIYERYVVSWKLNHLTQDDVRAATFSPKGDVVGVWSWGMPQNVFQTMASRRFPQIDTKISDELSHLISQSYFNLSNQEVESIGKKYRLDYIWAPQNVSDSWLQTFLRLKTELIVGDTRLFKVLGWRQ